MTNNLAFLVFLLISVTAASPGAHAQAQPAGKWKMTIEFTNGSQQAGLEIKISGRKVSGTFAAAFAGGEVPIEGEIDDRKITFSAATTGGPHPGMHLDFSAALRDDGTLAGKLAAPFGDFDFTAEKMK